MTTRAPALAEVVVRQSVTGQIGEIAKELSSARELLWQLTLRDLRIRYKQALFGLAWAVLMPGLIVLSGLLVRFAMVHMSASTFDRGVAASLAAKGLAWGFFAGAMGFATPSLVANGNLVSKVYFPREVLPLSAILAQAVDSSMAAALLILISPLLGIHLTASLLWLPLLVALLFCFTIAVGLLTSCANVFFRDVKYLVQMMMTFGIFFTPVFFEPVMLGATGAKLVMLNPLAPVLEGIRLVLIQGHNLALPLTSGSVVIWDPLYLVYAAVVSVGGLFATALIFHRAEDSFPEYL